MIQYPTEVLPTAELVAVVAGPVIYLVGHVLFRLAMAGTLSKRRLGGAVACALAGVLGIVAQALVVAALLVVVLAVIIGSEHAAGNRRRRHGEPSPLQKLEGRELAG